jgi:hypothetical protein
MMTMVLKEFTGRVLPQFRQPSVCEACGEQFACGAESSSCWCQEIKLSEATQAELRARYRRCLCRTCLENYAEVEKNNGEKEEQVSTGAAH